MRTYIDKMSSEKFSRCLPFWLGNYLCNSTNLQIGEYRKRICSRDYHREEMRVQKQRIWSFID